MSESARYSRYEAKMQRVGQILDGIKRHRIAVGLIATTIIALLICFLGMIGHFMGVPSCRDYIYGDQPACSVNAFLFDDMQYQFASAEGEAIWSNSSPILPGPYRIRAVSQNGFGQPKYSQAATFTLLARELNIHIISTNFVYGAFSLDDVKDNTNVEGLAPGDRIADLEYTVTEDEMGNYIVSVATICIVNQEGVEVTACYQVNSVDGCFSQKPRPITIRAKDVTKVYDGEEWQEATAELTEGTIAAGDRLQITFENLGFTDAGSYRLEPICTVFNVKGEDVSSCYEVTTKQGTLTIEKRPISVCTESAQKIYDGKPLIHKKWRVIEGTLPKGHPSERPVICPLSSILIIPESSKSSAFQSISDALTTLSLEYTSSPFTLATSRLCTFKVLVSPMSKIITGFSKYN